MIHWWERRIIKKGAGRTKKKKRFRKKIKRVYKSLKNGVWKKEQLIIFEEAELCLLKKRAKEDSKRILTYNI